MFIVHVFIHVKEEYIESFREASMENAKNSILEPGITRFDVLQQKDDPTRFVLIEIYRSENDTALHKERAHYRKWRDSVEAMMAEPRYSIKYNGIFPEELM
jgi:(4S)-4-hydroxy-5-phosphonooxypentane-2,3-dione isomerase